MEAVKTEAVLESPIKTSLDNHQINNPVEVKRIKQNNLSTLIFFVTNRCNFKCNHCFYWQSLNINDILSTENIKKIIDSIGDLDTLLMAGGEPFLRQDLAEISEYFIEKCHLRLLSIPTNGSMRNRILDFIPKISPKCKLRIYISIDGLKETHNHIRQVDSFDNCISMLKELVELKKKYNFSPLANVTVSNKNMHEIEGLAKIFNEIGVHYSVVPLRGAPKDGGLRPPTSKEWGDLIDKLVKDRQFLGPEASFHNNKTNMIKKIHRKLLVKFKTKMYQDALDGKRNYICKAGDEIGVIDYEGKVFFCELTKQVGDLKDFDYDFNKLWFSQKANDYRPEIQTCVCTHGCFIRSKYMRTAEWFNRMLSPILEI